MRVRTQSWQVKRWTIYHTIDDDKEVKRVEAFVI